GHSEDEQPNELRPVDIPKVDTIVFLMGLTKLATIVQSLMTSGWKQQTPVMVISKGTTNDEKIVSGTIRDIVQRIAADPLEPPALIVVGETVKFSEKWH